MSDRRLHILGWILFIISACGYLISSVRSGDLPGMVGSWCFLVACFVFLVPLLRERPRD